MKKLRFRTPVPVCKKNNMRSGFGRPRKSEKVRHSEQDIQAAAIEARGRMGKPLIVDHDVSMLIEHDVATDEVDITISDVGPAQCVPGTSKTGRKRDIQNLVDVICDALEGIGYTNDNQIAEILIKRKV
ncbi:MAG: RusA family crossover junction endodeoxyribonuclease [Planctomycetota bacterium]